MNQKIVVDKKITTNRISTEPLDFSFIISMGCVIKTPKLITNRIKIKTSFSFISIIIGTIDAERNKASQSATLIFLNVNIPAIIGIQAMNNKPLNTIAKLNLLNP